VKNQFKLNQFSVKYLGAAPNLTNTPFELVSHNDQELIVKSADEKTSNDFLKLMVQQNIHIQSFEEILPSLNEIFIRQVSQTQN
jgi:ABC-2 type transport system ATP-binding protein